MIAELADGRRLEFPDGTDPAVVQATVKKVLSAAAPQEQKPARIGAPQELSFAEKYIAPALEKTLGTNIQGSPVGRVIQGAADPGIGVTQLAMNAMGMGDKANQRVHDLEKTYQSERAASGSSGFDPLRLAGNIGTSVMVPGAGAAPQAGMLANILRGGATGALFSAAQPVTDAQPIGLKDLVTGNEPKSFWNEKGKQSLLGAGFGAAGAPISAALARIVRPATDPAARKLMDEGVNLTPGQILGGGFKRTEDALTSTPVLGDFIRDAQNRSMSDFNRAAYARALGPLGKDVSALPAGPEGVLAVKKTLGDAYEKLLPSLSFDARTIAPELKAVRQSVAGQGGLPRQEAQQFDAILKKNLGQLVDGKADGKTYQTIVANLRDKAKAFQGSTDGYQRQLGDALTDTVQVFRDGLTKSNPKYAAELGKINEGYANYARIRGAAASAGDKSSGFTPAQLAAAVRGQDQSAGKGATATGGALMQDLSDAARTVLPSKVNDSGTPFRHAVQLLAGAGGALAGGNAAIPGLAAGALGPTLGVAGLGALGTLPYTAAGQKAMQKILAERPEYAAQLAALLRQAGPVAGAAAAPALLQGP